MHSQQLQCVSQWGVGSLKRRCSSCGHEVAAGVQSPAVVAPASKRAARGAGESSSGYRGVTHHARSNRFEAHCWHGQRQVYLGGWDNAGTAALAADIAAVCLKGEAATLNYHRDFYTAALSDLRRCTIEEVAAALRALGRGLGGRTPQSTSIYRGVTRHQKGRWEARIGACTGRRYIYLGLHATELAAAQAYDRAAIAQKGVEAATNFHLSEYLELLTPAQVAEACQLGIITLADLAPLQQPLEQQLPPAEQMAATPLQLSPSAEGSQTPGGSSNDSSAAASLASPADHLAGLLLECIMPDGSESPSSVLPMMSLPAGKQAVA